MKFGIAKKVSLLFIMLVVVLAATLGFYFIRYQKATLEEEFDEKAKTLLYSMVVSVEYPLLVEDKETLKILGNGVLQQKDVIFCEIKNKEGDILFQKGSRNEKYVRQYISPVLTERVASLVREDIILDSEKKQTEETGKIYLIFSLAGLMEKLSQAKKTIGFLVIGGIVLAFVLISLLTRLVLGRPINELMRGIRKIIGGNLNYKVPIKTQDEIGILATSFNKMTGHLKQMVDNLNCEVAERKKAEELLEKLNIDLESTIQELSRSNRDLQEFAYIAAHDLKTPLRAIGTLADWLSTDYGDKLDQRGKEQLNLLVGRAKRIDKLIDSILQYSEVGRIGQKEQEVDLNIVLSDVISKIEPPDNIDITIEGELPTIICSKKRIVQVFQNLLSNAVRYMDKPKGQIKVECSEENGFWQFSVCDNGPGIEEKYFEKIFRIFQTLATRDEVEATGMGLPLTKKIVELYGGRIWVQSEPGQGSTFYFTLPKQEMRVKDGLHKANITC